MSLDENGLILIAQSSHLVGGNIVKKNYNYVTNDTAAVVEAVNYFDGVLDNGFNSGDIIFTHLDDDGTPETKIYEVVTGGATVTIKQAFTGSTSRIVDLNSATLSLLKATHDNKIITVNKADGSTITLPAAVGSGTKVEIVVGTTITSVGLVVQTASASDIMQGNALLGQDAGDTSVLFEAAADSDTITMNGSTTGGIKGDKIILIDIATGVWQINIVGSAIGTEATPFSAAI